MKKGTVLKALLALPGIGALIAAYAHLRWGRP